MKQFLNDTQGFINGAAAAMGMVISTLIAIVIGVMIWYKINASMYAAAGSPRVAANGSAIWNSTNASANTVWSLFPIICIVLIAGVVLAIIMSFGQQQA